jgi:hypothetical protein
MMWRLGRSLCAIGIAAILLTLAACSGDNVDYNYPRRDGTGVDPNPKGERETIFGPGGLDLTKAFGGGGEEGGAGGSGIGINSFLWRASLDTLSFMPLASADPFGGVIITDWYSPPETPADRFKMTVYILDRRLRADGLKVSVFRQHRNGTTEWRDASVDGQTAIQLENAILTRARQLRLDTLEQ